LNHELAASSAVPLLMQMVLLIWVPRNETTETDDYMCKADDNSAGTGPWRTADSQSESPSGGFGRLSVTRSFLTSIKEKTRRSR
jgi:hypothetical protein